MTPDSRLPGDLPLVSIITIVRNGMPHVRSCIDSLLAQDYPNVEIIVQDGSSTDGTIELLKSYGDRIQVISEPDSGHGEAMNRALQRCTGDIIGTCNADDELMPNAASWAVESFAARPDAGAIYGAFYEIDGEGRVLNGPLPGPDPCSFERILCVEDVPPMQSAFFRTSALQSAGLLDDPWLPVVCEDYTIWLWLGACSKIEYVPGIVARYRVHDGSGTWQPALWEKIYACKRESLERFLSRPDVSPAFEALRHRALGGLALSVAGMFLCHFDDPFTAMHYIGIARGEQPDAAHLNHFWPEIEEWSWKIAPFYQQGAELIGADRYDAALRIFEALTAVDYWIAGVNYCRAGCLLGLGRREEALAAVERELELHPEHGPTQELAQNLRREQTLLSVARRVSTPVSIAVPRNGHAGLSSKPKIDLILPGPPERPFSWNQREGWERALVDLGLLDRAYWVGEDEASVEALFQAVRGTSPDLILILSGDHHQIHLHDTPRKRAFWQSLGTPVVCHCAERILGSPFPDSEQKTRSALEAFDAFVYIDELSQALFDENGRPALWVPQYVDEGMFTAEPPFEGRINRVFFRGQFDNCGLTGVYAQRRALIAHLSGHPAFDISEAYRPMLTLKQAARLRAGYRFVLNAPANCTGYSAALYEALACGCVTFQYDLPVEEIRSRALFTPGVHFLAYDAGDADGLIHAVEDALSHWQDYREIAARGREQCLAHHTIRRRVHEIVQFLEANWARLGKSGGRMVSWQMPANPANSVNPVNPVADDAQNPLRAYAEVAEAVEGVEGYLIPGQEQYLFDKVRSLPDDAVIVEIGSFKGRSTVAMAYACVGTNRRVYCIDTWDGNDADFGQRGFFDAWQENVRRNGLDAYVVPLRGPSHEILPRWAELTDGRPIDFLFIDGSHQFLDVLKDFEIAYPMVKQGGWIAFHDVTPTWPGPDRLWNDIALHLLVNAETCSSLACGQKQREWPAHLPIHFFTIVLNGEPFIHHHIEVFRQLPFRWHWHIVEGVADLKHDTAWSLEAGGRITDDLHRNGLSADGTTAYLDALAEQYPDNVTIYRKPSGANLALMDQDPPEQPAPRSVFWDGKLEMVNAPLANIGEECLLWQVDADELWTIEQVCAVRAAFAQQPSRMAAYYRCHYFVGDRRLITTRDTYGNKTESEWLRTWRYSPGLRWTSHEPPRLCARASGNVWKDLATMNPFLHAETEARSLVFHHFAYATEEQVRFKESYYGYAGAVEAWRRLQARTQFPALLAEYFPWVRDGAMVDTCLSRNVRPLARKTAAGEWRFRHCEIASDEPQSVLFVRTDAIGDQVLAASMLPFIREKYPSAEITVVCQEHVAALYEACPHIDRIVTYNKELAFADESYRSEIVRRLRLLNPDLSLNSVYSRDPLTDVFSIDSGARERIALDCNLDNITAEQRARHNPFYTRLIPDAGALLPELERHRRFLQALEIDAPELQPVLWTKLEDEAFAEQLLADYDLQPERTIALFAGALVEVKSYERFGEALGPICRERGLCVIALGGPEQVEINGRNLAVLGVRAIDLSGKTTLRQAAALLRRCRLAIGADTGLAHMACAVGTPNVVLLGGGHFGRFMPYSPLTSVACLPLECFGCGWQCRFPTPHCVRDVAPEVIAEAVRQTLDATSERPRVFAQARGHWNPRAGQPAWGLPPGFLEGAVDINEVQIGREDREEMAQQAGAPEPESEAAQTEREPRVAEGECEPSVPAAEIRVSAIVSTYKSERFLRGCLEDLVGQTLFRKGELEIIVIDACSPEGEGAIVREFQAHYPHIVYERTPERERLYPSWNRGTAMARGRFIVNANTDDRRRPDCFEKLADALERTGAGIAYSDLAFTTEPNVPYERANRVERPFPDFDPKLAIHYNMGCYTIMWTQRAWKEVGGFDPQYPLAADFHFLTRVGLRFGAAHVAEPLTMALLHEGQQSQSHAAMDAETDRIRAEFTQLPLALLFPRADVTTAAARSRAYCALGDAAMRLREPWYGDGHPAIKVPSAAAWYAKALEEDPGNAAAWHNVALMAAIAGQPARGREMLARAAGIDPARALAYIAQAEQEITAELLLSIPLVPSGFEEAPKAPGQTEDPKAPAQAPAEPVAASPGTDSPHLDERRAADTHDRGPFTASPDKESLHVLFTMHGWADEGGGTIQPREIAKALVRRGHRVTAVYTSNKLYPGKPAYYMEKSREDGVDLIAVYNTPTVFLDPNNPAREADAPPMRQAMAALIRESRPDIVHYTSLLGFSMGVAEEVHRAGIPSVYTSFNYWPLCPRMFLFTEDVVLCSGPSADGRKCAACTGRFDKQADYARRAEQGRQMLGDYIDRHLAVSERVRELFIQSGHDAAKIRVLRQQPDKVDRLWQNVGANRKIDGPLARPLRVGFIGSLAMHKGAHVLLRALPAFEPEQIEAHIYGGGEDEYVALLHALNGHGLAKFHGRYKPAEIADVLSQVDVVVVPSIWEDCAPHVVCEALAARCPVIGSRIGGIPEHIEDGMTGLLVDPRDTIGLTMALHRFLEDPSLLGRLQSNIAAPRGFDAYMDEQIAQYREVMAERGAGLSPTPDLAAI